MYRTKFRLALIAVTMTALCPFNPAWSQSGSDFNDKARHDQGVRVVFYNVENLFHPTDDSLTNDGDFTPEGSLHWTWNRYREKLMKLSKVIIAVGGWEAPALVGFCEVENKTALTDLANTTPLKKHRYQVVHYDSPDERGIDVALLYRKDKFRLLHSEPLHVPLPQGHTRDVLYVKGLVLKKDTLHLFVNHWPSRRGGQAASEPRRMLAASVLRSIVDSILLVDAQANVVVMGDFNDSPRDRSVRETLRAAEHPDTAGALANLMHPLLDRKGSHRYQGHWELLDQIIVSESLYYGQARLKASPATVFEAGFLMEEDVGHGGMKPFRMYTGPAFHGGFSDHLPVFVDLLFGN